MRYYFLAASLPMLALDEPPPLSPEAFREQCAAHLSRRDLEGLDALLSGDGTACRHPFVRDWRNADTQIRNTLVSQRAARRQEEAAPWLREHRGYDVSLAAGAAEAYGRKTPLQRERALDTLRWRVAEDLAGFDPFTGRAMLAYGVKLLILRRWEAIDREKGEAAAGNLIRRAPASEHDAGTSPVTDNSTEAV
jgi:hypothetical protein